VDDRFVLRIRADQRELPIVSHLERLQNTGHYASVRAFSCSEWSVPSFTFSHSKSGTSYLNPHQRDAHAAQPENKGDIPLVVGVRQALCRLRREVKVWE